MKKNLKELAKITFSFFLLIALASFNYVKFETKTVTGEILDMKCYMTSGAHGPEHKDCAATCVKGGSPMGLLTSDGKVYLLVENHDKKDAYAQAKTHAGEQITVTGKVSEKGGLSAVIVDEVKPKG